MTQDWDAEADCEGMLCPLPVLRARKRLQGMAPGTVLRLRATDPMAAIDLPHFCATEGHALHVAPPEGAVAIYLIRKADREAEGVNPPAPQPDG